MCEIEFNRLVENEKLFTKYFKEEIIFWQGSATEYTIVRWGGEYAELILPHEVVVEYFSTRGHVDINPHISKNHNTNTQTVKIINNIIYIEFFNKVTNEKTVTEFTDCFGVNPNVFNNLKSYIILKKLQNG